MTDRSSGNGNTYYSILSPDLALQWEITAPLPEGQWKLCAPKDRSRQPSGGIMQPEGGIMFPEGLHDFHWPEGRGAVITL